MIELIQKSKYSFFLNVNVSEIEKFIKFIDKQLCNKDEDFYILHLGEKKRFEIVLGEEGEFWVTKRSVRIYMDSDELEYFRERLEDALNYKFFFPAEICERSYKKIFVTLYCTIN